MFMTRVLKNLLGMLLAHKHIEKDWEKDTCKTHPSLKSLYPERGRAAANQSQANRSADGGAGARAGHSCACARARRGDTGREGLAASPSPGWRGPRLRAPRAQAPLQVNRRLPNAPPSLQGAAGRGGARGTPSRALGGGERLAPRRRGGQGPSAPPPPSFPSHEQCLEVLGSSSQDMNKEQPWQPGGGSRKEPSVWRAPNPPWKPGPRSGGGRGCGWKA